MFRHTIATATETAQSILYKIIDLFVLKAILAFIIAHFTGISWQLNALLILMIIDTITGGIIAKQCNRFTSAGFKRGVYKLAGYFSLVFTFRLFEYAFINNTTRVSTFVLAFLSLCEIISILENLQLLGFPVPKGIVRLLLKQIKLKPISSMLDIRHYSASAVADIDKMLKYQVAAIDNEQLQRLLILKFSEWRSFLTKLWDIETDKKDIETIKFEVLSLFNTSIKEINTAWRKADIPPLCIDAFIEAHEPKVQEFLAIIHNTTKDTDMKSHEYMNYVTNNLIRLLYQTILDVQEGVYTCKKEGAN